MLNILAVLKSCYAKYFGCLGKLFLIFGLSWKAVMLNIWAVLESCYAKYFGCLEKLLC